MNEFVLDVPKNNFPGIFLNPVQAVENFGLELGMQVADFGAGAGHFTKAMADVVGGSGKVTAIDILGSTLEVIEGQKRIGGLFQIQTMRGDLEKLNGSNLPDGSQDLVLCANVLHQVQKPENVLSEAHRVLKLGGKLFVIDWFEHGILGPTQRISKDLVEKLAFEVGLKKTREIDAGGSHYGIEFKK